MTRVQIDDRKVVTPDQVGTEEDLGSFGAGTRYLVHYLGWGKRCDLALRGR